MLHNWKVMEKDKISRLLIAYNKDCSCTLSLSHNSDDDIISVEDHSPRS